MTAFSHSATARLIKHPKFYFFDLGVLNALLGNFRVSPDRMGMLFETFVFNQIRSIIETSGKNFRLSTYQTEGGAEVDLILEYEDQVWAIEITATKNIGENDLRGLKSFSDSYPKRHPLWIFYHGTNSMLLDDIHIFPLDHGLQALLKISR